MKTAKTTFVAGMIFVLMALVTLAACGGSGGSGCGPAPVSGGGSGCGPEPEPIPEPGPGPTLMLKLIPEDKEITVSWTRIPSLPSPEEYTVFWSDSEDGEPLVDVGSISGISASDSDSEMLEATITGLENGTKYWVWVEAGGETGDKVTIGKELCIVTDGKTWYVRSSSPGNDNNDGLSIDAPLQSVMKALQKAAADKAAYPDKWKKGVSAKIVILDLSGPTEITLDDTYPPITLGGTPENPATINGTLTITGGDANSPPVTLAHVTLNGGGSDVVKVEGGNLVIEDGAVITGGGNGVVVNSGGAVTMSGDSRIWGNSGNGVEMTGGAFNMTGGEIGANGKNGVKTSGGGVFTKRGGGTVYGNGGSVPTDLRNTRGSINDIPKTFVPDDNF